MRLPWALSGRGGRAGRRGRRACSVTVVCGAPCESADDDEDEGPRRHDQALLLCVIILSGFWKPPLRREDLAGLAPGVAAAAARLPFGPRREGASLDG